MSVANAFTVNVFYLQDGHKKIHRATHWCRRGLDPARALGLAMQRIDAYNVVMLSDNFVYERGLIHAADALSSSARAPLNTVARPQSLADETYRP